MPNEKIEVGYRHIGTWSGVEYHHKFLLYTDQKGQQYTISGWTGKEVSPQYPLGKIHIEANWIYDKDNADSISNKGTAWYKDEDNNPISPQKQYRELIAEAPDLSAKWAEMVQNARSKDNIYPYDYLRQNSNTLADTVLREAGFPEPKKDGMFHHLAPGSGNKLDSTLTPKNPNNPSISDVGDAISLEENIREQTTLHTADNTQKPQSQADELHAMIQGLMDDHDGSFAKKLLAENQDVVDAFEAKVQANLEKERGQYAMNEIPKETVERDVGGRSFG